jgi:TusA-related sulfurtransferase
MVKRIDCKNLACPEPVLRTKDALEEMKEGVLEVEVNSFSSVQNVKKFASNSGLFIDTVKKGKITVLVIVKGYECQIDLEDSKNETKSFWTLIAGAAVTAVLASTCCLGPLLFLMFGVSMGSLSFLNVFTPYHTYFSIAAVVITGYLWWNWFFRLRKKPVCEGSICKNYVKYLSMGTLFVAIMLSYPYWAQYLLGE